MFHRNLDKGKGFLILYLTPSKSASTFVSGSLQIVDVLPGYTLGGFFCAHYHTDTEAASGSIIEFSTIPALTKWNGKKFFYINTADPTRKPELIWEKENNRISLYCGDDSPPYISIKIMPIAPGLPFRFCLPFVELKGEGVILPRSVLVSKVAISSSYVSIPSSSPLFTLPFRGKVFTITFSLGQTVMEGQKLIKGKILEELKTGVCGRII